LSPKRISHLGPEGTFTDQACHVYAPADWERVGYPEMHQVVAALVDGEVDEAIVPIENSVGGAVIDIVDFLVGTPNVQIKGEMLLGIEQCLIAHPGVDLSEIKIVRSKPEALTQCRMFMDAHLPEAARVGTASTVEAVYKVKTGTNEVSAIGPRRAAELAGLPVIRSGIQDRQNNVTRFVILGKSDHETTGADKTSIVFSFMNRDTPGQLYMALEPFARRNINLTKIESRPTGSELGRYIFILDFLGHRTEPHVVETLDEIRPHVAVLKVLGSYPRAYLNT
jgi:prephenate dehydratase